MNGIPIRIAVLVVAWCCLPAGRAPANEQVGKWTRFEAALDNSTWQGNPFDVELKGTFHSPSGRSLTQWGFYAGDNIWKIFFMPDEIGTWTFRTQSPNSDLDGKRGSFTCVPSELPGLLHGEGPHWVLGEEGGTFPILWNPPMSDGVRWGFRSRLRSHDTIEEALEFAAGTVGARLLGFDALLIVPTGWAEDWPQSAVPYVIGQEGVQFHLPFWDRLNAKLDAARDRGMGHYIMLYSDDELRPDLFGLTPRSKREMRFLRYAVARLACYPIVLWDSGIDIGEYRSGDWIDWYVEWFKENDPWRHPVGSRTGGGSGGKIPEGATYFSTGGAYLPGRDALIEDYWATATRLSIPVAHTDHWRPYIARGDWSHEKIRIAHWRCALSGGQALYPDYNQGRFVWSEVAGQGGPWIGHASRFFQTKLRTDMRRLLPDDRIVRNGDNAIAAANPGKEYVVYLEEGGRVELDLTDESGTLEARWYNPRTGEYSGPKNRGNETGPIAFSSPTQGPHKDWVLHVYAEGN